MRICVVAGWMYPDSEGGSARMVFETATRLAARGHEVHVITPRTPQATKSEEFFSGLYVHRCDLAGASGKEFYAETLAKVPARFLALHRNLRFEVIHAHHLASAYAVATIEPPKRPPLVFSLYIPYFLEHEDWKGFSAGTWTRRLSNLLLPFSAAVLKRMEASLCRKAARVIVISKFVEALVKKHYGVANRLVRIPPGVDGVHFHPQGGRAEARGQLGLPAAGRLLFTVRRLEARMGIENLLGAVRLLAPEHPDLRLIVGGRGGLEGWLKEQAKKLNVDDRVKWAGYIAEEDLPFYYRAADAVVLPTRALEGFGLVLLEALASGVPVLGTPVGAIPEVLNGIDPRLLLPGGDPESIAVGIRRWFARRASPQEGARLRAEALRQYDWAESMARYERTLEAAIGAVSKAKPR